MTILVGKKSFFTTCNEALFFWGAFVVCSCTSSPESGTQNSRVHQGETQGTTYRIKYHGEDSISQRSIDAVLESIDVEFNLWRPDSRINAINTFKSDTTVYAFQDTNRLWSVIWGQCLDLYEASGGAFDPTVHPLVELWGFGLENKSVVSEEEVAEILLHVGMTTDRIDLDEKTEARIYQETHVRKGDSMTSLDFNAIAQGLTVDLLGDALESRHILNYMVEVGGEVKCKGLRQDGLPWRIAIDRPTSNSFGDRELEVIVNVVDAAICTSGSYRKFHEVNGVRRSHTISPVTGYPVDHGLLSVTIMAANASLADGLATACMVLGPELGKQFISDYQRLYPEEGVEAYFISTDSSKEFDFWETAGWSRALNPESQL